MSLFTFLVVVALLATVASLMWAWYRWFCGGEYDEDHSAKADERPNRFPGFRVNCDSDRAVLKVEEAACRQIRPFWFRRIGVQQLEHRINL